MTIMLLGGDWKFEGAANEDGRKPSIWDTFAHGGNGTVQTNIYFIYYIGRPAVHIKRPKT